MHVNTRNAFLRRYKGTITKLVELEEQGVDVGRFLNITADIVNLLDRSKLADSDFVALLNIIVGCRAAESAEV